MRRGGRRSREVARAGAREGELGCTTTTPIPTSSHLMSCCSACLSVPLFDLLPPPSLSVIGVIGIPFPSGPRAKILLNQILREEPMIAEKHKPTLRGLVQKLVDKMEAPPGIDFQLFKASHRSEGVSEGGREETGQIGGRPGCGRPLSRARLLRPLSLSLSIKSSR